MPSDGDGATPRDPEPEPPCEKESRAEQPDPLPEIVSVRFMEPAEALDVTVPSLPWA